MAANSQSKKRGALCFFGSPRLVDRQGGEVALPAKAYLLLLYLSLSKTSFAAPRSSLQVLLWPDADRRKASNNLRQLIARMRAVERRCGVRLIAGEATRVELILDDVTVDVIAFSTLMARGEAEIAPEDLLAVHQGELFAGVAPEGKDLQDWLSVQRTRLRDEFAAAASGVLRCADVHGDSGMLRALADRLLAIDPYHEEGARALMRIYAARGDAARVREVYGQFRRRLRADLETEPDPETTKCFRDLTRDGETGAARESVASVPLPPAGRGGLPKITILRPAEAKASDPDHQVACSLIEEVELGLYRRKALSLVKPYSTWELGRIDHAEEALIRYAVDYVAETRIFDTGNVSSLSVKLFSTQDRQIVWADKWTMSATEISDRFEETAHRIIAALIQQVARSEMQHFESRLDRAAYHAFLHGVQTLEEIDLRKVRRARRYFRSVLASYPSFAPALCGLARTFHSEWLLTARHEFALLSEAEALARRAITADPDDARGYRELGATLLCARRFDDSLEALATAESCDPQFAELQVDFADSLIHSGAEGEGRSKLERAMELNPWPSDLYWWTEAGMHYQLGDYSAAIETAGQMKDQWPVSRLLAAAWAQLGEKERAREYVDSVLDIYPDFRTDEWLSMAPLKNASDVKHYEEGLRAAGFE